MILVDLSVWIDYFRGTHTSQVEMLDRLLGEIPLAVGDIILTEVLQGFTSDRDFNRARQFLAAFDVIEIAGVDVKIPAAQNFRRLRALGITVRKTTDTLIATRCIESGHSLLYSDRDFDPFVEHLGLERAAWA